MNQTTDPSGRGLVALAAAFPFPEYVKAASVSDLLAPRAPLTACADRRQAQLPCDSRANTWLSAAYFAKYAAAWPVTQRAEITTRLQHFATYWGCRPDVDSVFAKAAADMQELSDEDFAYVRQDENGHVERRLPLRGPAEVKAAAAYLQRFRDDITYADRSAIARRVLAKAASWNLPFDLPTETFLQRQAGCGGGVPAEVAQLCRDRCAWTSAPAVKQAYEQLATAVETDPLRLLNPEAAPQLVAAIEHLDRAVKLAGHYTPQYPPPEDVVFSCTPRKAADVQAETIAWADGRVFARDDLRRLSRTALTEAFGSKFAAAVCQPFQADPDRLRDAVQQLKRADVHTFEHLLAQMAIQPLHQPALDDATLQSLSV